MSPAGRAIFVLCFVTSACTHSPPTFTLPTEEDTVLVGRTVVLVVISGQILKKGEDGKLSPVANHVSVRPGEVVLVRKGASFSIGGTTIAPESHGDRWVRFE
jgi:hypothetical protein